MTEIKSNCILAAGITAAYLLLLALLALALQNSGSSLAHFSLLDSPQEPSTLQNHLDEWEYQTLGHSMLHSGTFTLDGVHPEFFRTPGYPLVLAGIYALFDSPIAVILFQILLVAASAVLIARIGERLSARWVGVGAALMYALDPTVFLSATAILSDTLFVFLLLCCAYILVCRDVSYRSALLVGVLSGYLALVRPIGEYAIPVFALWCAYLWYTKNIDQTRRIARATLVAACVLLAAGVVVGPWLWRNYELRGRLSLSSVSAYNLLFFNIAIFNAYQTGETQDTVTANLKHMVGTSDETSLRDLAYTKKIEAVTAQQLHGRIRSYAMFHIEKLAPFYFDSSVQTMLQTLHQHGILAGPGDPPVSMSLLIMQGKVGDALKFFVRNPFTLLERLLWVLVVLLCVAALLFARGMRRVMLLFFATMALVFGILTGPVAFPRYRLPAEPFLLLGAWAGLAMAADKARLLAPKTRR